MNDNREVKQAICALMIGLFLWYIFDSGIAYFVGIFLGIFIPNFIEMKKEEKRQEDNFSKSWYTNNKN